MGFQATVREWFKTDLRPSQDQFWAGFNFLRWKDEKVPVADIEDIEDILNAKAEAAVLTHHLTDVNAHADLFLGKEDKSQKGSANGYAPLDEFTKIARQYLTIIDDLVTGGSDALSAEQGKLLQTQIDGINTLLASDDINLDTVQELVDAIKTVETSLETILVNDLTTGGVTKALTAEMGKSLKALIDNIGSSLAVVATTGSYNDLLDKPSIRSVQHEYATIPLLKADQANQSQGAFQAVTDASGDPTVTSGYAYYEFLGTTTAAMADYRKLSEQESMDLVPITRTSQLDNDGSTGTDPFVEQTGFDAAMALKANILKAIVPEPNITKTLALSDAGKAIRNTNANPTTITVPTNAAIPLPIGFEVDIISEGAGVVTIATAGLTVISDLQSMVMSIGEVRTLIKLDTNTWSIKGNSKTILPTVSSGEKVITVTSSGLQTTYDLIDPYVGTTTVATLDAADWSSGSVSATGAAGEERFGANYQYKCTGTNVWRRAINYGLIVNDLILGNLDDSSGIKTSTQMAALYTTAVSPQKVIGNNGVYEYYDLKGWFYFANTITQ